MWVYDIISRKLTEFKKGVLPINVEGKLVQWVQLWGGWQELSTQVHKEFSRKESVTCIRCGKSISLKYWWTINEGNNSIRKSRWYRGGKKKYESHRVYIDKWSQTSVESNVKWQKGKVKFYIYIYNTGRFHRLM